MLNVQTNLLKLLFIDIKKSKNIKKIKSITINNYLSEFNILEKNNLGSINNLLRNKTSLNLLLVQKPITSYLYMLNFFLINLLSNNLKKNIFINLNNYNKNSYQFSIFFKKIKNLFKKTITLRRLKITLRELGWVFFILLKYKDLSLFKS
jgi:hypothetical protein